METMRKQGWGVSVACIVNANKYVYKVCTYILKNSQETSIIEARDMAIWKCFINSDKNVWNLAIFIGYDVSRFTCVRVDTVNIVNIRVCKLRGKHYSNKWCWLQQDSVVIDRPRDINVSLQRYINRRWCWLSSTAWRERPWDFHREGGAKGRGPSL